MARVFLVAGHGGSDPGAVAYGVTEHELVRIIVTEVTSQLQRAGIEVLTPNFDTSLYQKIQFINRYSFGENHPQEIVISCHINAAANKNTNGMETWYDDTSGDSKKLAKIINSAVVEKTQMRDRGIKSDRTNRHGRLGILRDTRPRAALLELGFITNIDDLNRIKNSQQRPSIVAGIIDGIFKHFDIKNPHNSDPEKTADMKRLAVLTNDMRQLRLEQKDELAQLNQADSDADAIRSQQNYILEEKASITDADIAKLIELSDEMHYIRVAQKEALSRLNLLDAQADQVRISYIQTLDKYR